MAIIEFIYNLTANFFVTIVLFSLTVRCVLFPMYFKSHKNSIRLLNLQPKLNKLKRIHAGNREALSEAQYELFKAEKYRPLLGLVPLLAQLGVLVVVISIIQNTIAYSGIELGFWGESSVLLWVMSGFSALIFCLVQNKITPGALSQSKGTNIFMTAFTVVFSIYFAVVTPAAIGLYWTVSNVLSIGVIVILEKIYSPKKYAGEALSDIKKFKNIKPPKITRKQTVREFNKAKKQLVFYALSGGQYKYYRTVIDYILRESDVVIHYLTNDPNDRVLDWQIKNFKPYYISQKRTITTLLRLECDVIVTTVQDLQVYHMKRSVAKDDIEYIHIPHGMASLHLTAREEAYDYFDTFFAVGPHQANEIRRREEMANLHTKILVKAGYGLYDELCKAYDGNTRKQILIAPSWQEDNILDICIESLLEELQKTGYKIIVRPHPQYIGIFPERIDELKKIYPQVEFDTDFLSSENIFSSEYIITDWSGIAFEFSFCTLRPSIFINTPTKILNENYEKYGLEVTDIIWRDKVGVSVDVSDIGKLPEILINFPERNISEVIEEYLYHPHRSGEAGGKYILGVLKNA